MTLRHIILLPVITLAGAVSAVVSPPATAPIRGTGGTKSITMFSKFVRAAGGTNVKIYLQTSFDGGVTWCDIACHTFLTTTANKISKVMIGTALGASIAPTDGTLADDTIVDGLLGSQFRIKYTTTGTYSGASSLEVHAVLTSDAP